MAAGTEVVGPKMLEQQLPVAGHRASGMPCTSMEAAMWACCCSYITEWQCSSRCCYMLLRDASQSVADRTASPPNNAAGRCCL
jgi:hypothetical protein